MLLQSLGIYYLCPSNYAQSAYPRNGKPIAQDNTAMSQEQDIILIAVMAAGRAIGYRNGLLCHLPEDLRHFRKLTMGHHIIMGRKTYESIGTPLPGRISVVMSHHETLERQSGMRLVHSWEEALQACEEDSAIYVVGGAQIYELAMPHATKIILTRMDKDFPVADAFFPEIKEREWVRTAEGPWQESIAGVRYRIEEYTRKA